MFTYQVSAVCLASGGGRIKVPIEQSRAACDLVYCACSVWWQGGEAGRWTVNV